MTSFRISTASFAIQDRTEGVRENWGRTMLQIEMEPLTRGEQILIALSFGAIRNAGELANGRGIGAIAYESGFGDLSYFNHSFRRRYGAKPSDIRANRIQDHGLA